MICEGSNLVLFKKGDPAFLIASSRCPVCGRWVMLKWKEDVVFEDHTVEEPKSTGECKIFLNGKEMTNGNNKP